MLTILAVSAFDAGRYAAYVTMAVLLVALVRRILSGRRSRRSRLTDSIAACVVAVLLIGNVVRASGDGPSWSSSKGVEMRAGFVEGCESTSGGSVDCTRAFDCLVSKPEYDTPKELEDVLEPAVAANDPSALPAEYLAALASCARA